MRIIDYTKKIWAARYFWSHLAIADIRAKYRRSLLGILWAGLFPLALTLLLSTVMSRIFNTDITDYAPYIFIGIVVWDFIVGTTVSGCTALINAEIYIKQYTHPLAIYPLRYTLASLINFTFSFIGVLIWVLIWKPSNIGWSWLSIPISTLLMLFLGWPLAILSSFISARFRDFQQLAILLLQAVWYVSPVFIDEKVFKNSQLHILIDYNPIYHLLNLFRAPLLHGNFPSMSNYIWILFSILLFWLISLILIKNKEHRIIFYL